MHRQRAAGVHERRPATLADRAGRIDEGGRLAHDAADGQNDAGEDAGHGATAARCVNTVRSLPAPRPKLPSRNESGTAFRASSVVRRMVGRTMMASVSAPASMRFVHVQGDDEQQVAEQAVDDGWDA